MSNKLKPDITLNEILTHLNLNSVVISSISDYIPFVGDIFGTNNEKWIKKIDNPKMPLDGSKKKTGKPEEHEGNESDEQKTEEHEGNESDEQKTEEHKGNESDEQKIRNESLINRNVRFLRSKTHRNNTNNRTRKDTTIRDKTNSLSESLAGLKLTIRQYFTKNKGISEDDSNKINDLFKSLTQWTSMVRQFIGQKNEIIEINENKREELNNIILAIDTDIANKDCVNCSIFESISNNFHILRNEMWGKILRNVKSNKTISDEDLIQLIFELDHIKPIDVELDNILNELRRIRLERNRQQLIMIKNKTQNEMDNDIKFDDETEVMKNNFFGHYLDMMQYELKLKILDLEKDKFDIVIKYKELKRKYDQSSIGTNSQKINKINLDKYADELKTKKESIAQLNKELVELTAPENTSNPKFIEDVKNKFYTQERLSNIIDLRTLLQDQLNDFDNTMKQNTNDVNENIANTDENDNQSILEKYNILTEELTEVENIITEFKNYINSQENPPENMVTNQEKNDIIGDISDEINWIG